MFYSTYSFFCETAKTYGPYSTQNLTTMDITAIIRIRMHLQHSVCVCVCVFETSSDEDIQGSEGKIPQTL
jgi:hypothetical protein